MSLFQFPKPFVSVKDFEENIQGQKQTLFHFLKLLRRVDKSMDEERQIEFFFYSQTMEDAESLKKDLEKTGYEVYGIDKSENGKYSIIGLTSVLSLDEKCFENWIDKMNEFGFINDCEFDGWGMLITNFDDQQFPL